MPPAIAAVLPSSERKRPPAAPRSQPFCGEIHFVRALRGERSCPASMVKSSACPFDTLAREARGTDIRASAERLFCSIFGRQTKRASLCLALGRRKQNAHPA